MATGEKKGVLMLSDIGVSGGVAGYDATDEALAALNAALGAKADLGEDGKVPSEQLPETGGGLAHNLTLYVNADTGNRDNDGLTPETPLNTISLALSKAPKNLNGHTLTIRLAAGIYDEFVSVAGFYGGKLQNRGSIIITGALESGARLSTVKSITNNSTGACVLLRDLTITGTVSISGGAAMQAMGLRITGDGTGVGVLCEQGIGNFIECSISNKNIAVQATMGGIIFLSGYAVYSGNAIGLQSTAAGNQYPGIILSQYQVTGTTDNVKGAGAISVGGTWL